MDSQPFTQRTWPERLEIIKTLEVMECAMRDYCGDGFTIAVGRGRYAEAVSYLKTKGFHCTDLYHFPLGTDKPSMHLRHDVKGFERCCWLIAGFRPSKTASAEPINGEKMKV